MAGGVAVAAPAPALADGPDPALLTAYPVIRPRVDWAAGSCPVRGPLPAELPGDVLFLLVHHTAEPGNDYAADAVPGLLRGMYAFHTGPDKGWPDLAYNFVVDRYGGIWEARAGSRAAPVVPSATGGTQGFDQLGCFLGNHATEPPTPQAQASMISLLAWLSRRYGVDPTPGSTATFASRGSNRWPAGTPVTTPTIEGHRAMSLTTCPGDAAYPQVRGLFPAAVTQLLGPVSAIEQHYRALGGPASFLGRPTSRELRAGDRVGRHVDYQHGEIWWSPASGAHEVHGRIRARWAARGAERSFLGYPTTDELGCPDGRGRYGAFQGGSVYWTPTTGAHEVRGRIRDAWFALGAERSWLGYPVSDERAAPGGRLSAFEGGRAVYSARTGAVTFRRR
ncbi:MAG TPA: N-acetylmuramoyl-L-alanine amidase [Mycobacteriales bacterium]|nr:N-acetylmuramoyl-L-alanine amidase [Mycobacteriales bacterium]